MEQGKQLSCSFALPIFKKELKSTKKVQEKSLCIFKYLMLMSPEGGGDIKWKEVVQNCEPNKIQ